ncbi:MAG: preprotein translocase subunit SecG [Bacteroidota bacterium]|nr:preprotein translocase subunit SecG [Bacteroidota bacterium]
MGPIISILLVIVCILLILVVLVQNSKGGGLASSFSSSNQVMGVRKTADFLEKATWTLAIALLALSLISTAYNKPVDGVVNSDGSTSKTKDIGAGKTDAPTTAAPGAPGLPAPVADPNKK